MASLSLLSLAESREDLLILLIVVGIPVALLLGTLVIGAIGRSRHRQRLAQRRSSLAGFLVTDLKSFPGGAHLTPPPAMVVAEAVYSAGNFATFASNLKKIIGGNLGFYRDLAERTREEVTLRLLETARANGYDAVCNLRIEWSDITGTTTDRNSQKKAAMVSLMATGTAYRRPAGT